ncbi:MAG: hypothetical protein ACJ77A_10075 [Actinomycetota bacterium]
MNFSTQVHDYNPGITPYPSGLFWTERFPADSVNVNLGDGYAHMSRLNMPITDYFDIPNALFRFEDPVSEPATCSFDIHWSGPVTDVSHVNDPQQGFAGKFVLSQATMTWSAHNAGGFRFESHHRNTTSVFAQLGRMRNGVFFGD